MDDLIKDTKKEVVIRCPKCDYEYLPSEIFIAKHLVGDARDVERTYDGKIYLHNGIMQDFNESFICEHCGKPFKVKANMSFETTYDAENDVTEDYITSLYKKDRLHLDEN